MARTSRLSPSSDPSARGSAPAIGSAVQDIAGRLDFDRQKLVILLNKTDILGVNKLVKNVNSVVLSPDYQDKEISVLAFSAKTGYGLENLRSQLVSAVGPTAFEGTLVTNARHAQALRSAAESLSVVSDGLDQNIPSDLLAEDLRAALASLGSITGEITTDEVLGEIFSRFCIGK